MIIVLNLLVLWGIWFYVDKYIKKNKHIIQTINDNKGAQKIDEVKALKKTIRKNKLYIVGIVFWGIFLILPIVNGVYSEITGKKSLVSEWTVATQTGTVALDVKNKEKKNEKRTEEVKKSEIVVSKKNSKRWIENDYTVASVYINSVLVPINESVVKAISSMSNVQQLIVTMGIEGTINEFVKAQATLIKARRKLNNNDIKIQNNIIKDSLLAVRSVYDKALDMYIDAYGLAIDGFENNDESLIIKAANKVKEWVKFINEATTLMNKYTQKRKELLGK